MNAFVTGGSRGIGRAIVLKMVEEGRGCAFTYRTNSQAAEETISLARGINHKILVRSYQIDIRNPREVESCVEEAIKDFKQIQIIVNNAAVVRDNATVMMSDEEWEEVIATNLSGPFYVIRSFLMHLIAKRKGRIINISSLSQDGSSGQANYAASKAGLIGLTKTLAKEYGPKGITTNAVVAGLVETDLSREHVTEKQRKMWLELCPMKRIGTAEEIASLVHYLTTEEAGFINGEVIRVAGGVAGIP